MARTVGYSTTKVVKVFGVNNFKGKNEVRRELDGLLKHTLKIPGWQRLKSQAMVWGIKWRGLNR